MGDWMMDNLGWVLVGVISVFFGVFIFCAVIESQDEGKAKTEIAVLGYDIEDVDVFLDSIGRKFQDFQRSAGLRKQYESFKEGKTSDFMSAARSKKNSDEARNNDVATGIAVGVALNSGRR